MLKKCSRILTKLQRSNLIIFLVNTLKLSSSSISLNYIFKYLQYLFKKKYTKSKITLWYQCLKSLHHQQKFQGAICGKKRTTFLQFKKEICPYGQNSTVNRLCLYISKRQICKYRGNQTNHLRLVYLKTVKWVMKIHEKYMFNNKTLVPQTIDTFSSDMQVIVFSNTKRFSQFFGVK